MSSKKARSRKRPLGRAQFIVQDEDQTLEVRLDRQGFRRLLLTLETLAQDGGKQDFERSGRQSSSRNGSASKEFSPTKITFHLDEAAT